MYQKSQQDTQKIVPEFLILSALKLPSFGLMVFIDMNTCILTEGQHSELMKTINDGKTLPSSTLWFHYQGTLILFGCLFIE